MAFSVVSFVSTLNTATLLAQLTYYESVTLIIIDCTSLAHYSFLTTGVQDSYDLHHRSVMCAQMVLDPCIFWALYPDSVGAIPV